MPCGSGSGSAIGARFSSISRLSSVSPHPSSEFPKQGIPMMPCGSGSGSATGVRVLRSMARLSSVSTQPTSVNPKHGVPEMPWGVGSGALRIVGRRAATARKRYWMGAITDDI